MTAAQSRKFIYKNSITWQGEKRGFLAAGDKPGFPIATPPEFRGHAGVWSPEDLFVASVNGCIMTTFLHYAERKGLELLSYETEAEGILERVENQFRFSGITVKPVIAVKDNGDIQRAGDFLVLAEKGCLISNSIKARITVIPEIKQGVDKCR